MAFGFALGWGSKEALVIAGATGISSSAIVTKLLVELRRLGNPETRLILGIIVLEDLFLALYLAALAPILGQADGVGESIVLFVRALAFLIVLGLVARFGTRVVGAIITSKDDELLVVLFVGFALLVAGIAYQLGVSDAIGAFMAGLVLAGTAAARRIQRLVLPLRDAFAALFFFAFGLSIDPGDIGPVIAPAAAAIVMSIVLAVVAGIGVARMNRMTGAAAANIAFTVVARGEFALILVALATQAGLDRRLAPFVAVYVLDAGRGQPDPGHPLRGLRPPAPGTGCCPRPSPLSSQPSRRSRRSCRPGAAARRSGSARQRARMARSQRSSAEAVAQPGCVMRLPRLAVLSAR